MNEFDDRCSRTRSYSFLEMMNLDDGKEMIAAIMKETAQDLLTAMFDNSASESNQKTWHVDWSSEAKTYELPTLILRCPWTMRQWAACSPGTTPELMQSKINRPQKNLWWVSLSKLQGNIESKISRSTCVLGDVHPSGSPDNYCSLNFKLLISELNGNCPRAFTFKIFQNLKKCCAAVGWSGPASKPFCHRRI